MLHIHMTIFLTPSLIGSINGRLFPLATQQVVVIVLNEIHNMGVDYCMTTSYCEGFVFVNFFSFPKRKCESVAMKAV